MSFDIKIHGRIGSDLRGLARRHMTRTLDALTALRPGAVGDAPHEIRKGLKKLRALLALLREPLGKKTVREKDAVLRDVGRALGALRDAQAMLRTIERLQKRFFVEKSPALVRTLRQALAAQERRCTLSLGRSKRLPAGAAALRELLAAAALWPLEDYGWKELRRAIQRSYRRAREAFRKAHSDPSSRRLHQWRKGVKELWYHIRLLRRVCPMLMEELAQDFEVLAEFLGDEHDLVVLRAAVERRPKTSGGKTARKTFLALLELRRKELREAAFDLGERLLADPPADFVRQLDQRRESRRKRQQQAGKLVSKIAPAR